MSVNYACVVGHIALVDRICYAAVRQFYSAKIAVAALGVNVEIIESARFIDTLVKVKLAAKREFCEKLFVSARNVTTIDLVFKDEIEIGTVIAEHAVPIGNADLAKLFAAAGAYHKKGRCFP